MYQGGLVGNDVNSINPIVQGGEGGLSQVTSALLQLIKINEDIRSLQDGTKNKTNNLNKSNDAENAQSNAVSIAPVINITINGNGQTQSQTTAPDSGSQNPESIKAFAEIMRGVALQTIEEQRRPGGSLESTRNR